MLGRAAQGGRGRRGWMGQGRAQLCRVGLGRAVEHMQGRAGQKCRTGRGGAGRGGAGQVKARGGGAHRCAAALPGTAYPPTCDA